MLSVEFQNVSKIYKLYAKPIDRLKEVIFRKPYHQAFSALQSLSFSVAQGESMGILGDNGAGKSTLLKILAGTLRQTSGMVTKIGRVSALLELGAGFHTEFTGRQNIYLNASLLGLKQEEIKAKEQEIIEFSELGEFIDRPVKIYSSGMYVRLAFSIATSVDPDILVIDEALSVGDQRFQKKCIDRMMGFRKSGKTIIFCSHSMYHISELCEKAMWVKSGRIEALGDKNSVITAYEKWSQRKYEEENQADPYSSSPIRISDIRVVNSEGVAVTEARKGDHLTIEIHIESRDEKKIHIGIGFQTISGDDVIFGTTTKWDNLAPVSVKQSLTVSVAFPDIHFISGSYKAFGVLLDDHGIHVYDVKVSEVIDIIRTSELYGKHFMKHEWHI